MTAVHVEWIRRGDRERANDFVAAVIAQHGPISESGLWLRCVAGATGPRMRPETLARTIERLTDAGVIERTRERVGEGAVYEIKGEGR